MKRPGILKPQEPPAPVPHYFRVSLTAQATGTIIHEEAGVRRSLRDARRGACTALAHGAEIMTDVVDPNGGPFAPEPFDYPVRASGDRLYFQITVDIYEARP